MATVTVDETSLAAIAGAIREKNGTETTYRPADMAPAILGIETGTELAAEDEGKVVVESSGEYVLAAQTSLSVTENGTYDTTTNDEVTVSVSGGGGGAVPLEKFAENASNGYLSSGTFYYDNSGNCRYDMYEVLGGHTYLVGLGSHVGNRFRLSVTQTDVTGITYKDDYGSSAVNMMGSYAYDKDGSNVLPNMSFICKVGGTIKKYIIVQKSNIGESDVNTYAYDLTSLAPS